MAGYKKTIIALAFWTALSAHAATTKAAPLVVLIPGSGSSADRMYLDRMEWSTRLFKSNRYFGLYEDSLKSMGIDTFVCPKQQDQDTRTLQQRADDCTAAILAARPQCSDRRPSRSVHLVGHSMGGLIARLLAQGPKTKRCISSVTTLSTPHRGTPLADFVIDHKALDETSVDLYGRLARLIRFVPERKHYIPELRTDHRGAARDTFRAQELPDNKAVRYFSITTAIDRPSLHPLQLSRLILSREIKKRGLDATPYGDRNDGIVPEYSMVHGTLLGRLEIDHWSSACLDPIKSTESCSKAKALLFGHLEKLVH